MVSGLYLSSLPAVDLLSLLQWKEHPDMIQQALDHVLHLGGEELVKFLQDVLDALFSMFSTEDGNSTTHSGLVFHALVSANNVMTVVTAHNNRVHCHVMTVVTAHNDRVHCQVMTVVTAHNGRVHCQVMTVVTAHNDRVHCHVMTVVTAHNGHVHCQVMTVVTAHNRRVHCQVMTVVTAHNNRVHCQVMTVVTAHNGRVHCQVMTVVTAHNDHVSIFSLMDDSKFEHFRPVMDAYIKGHFAAALVYNRGSLTGKLYLVNSVHRGLLSSVQHCADWVSSTEKQEPIQKCFRSLEYIFKFIIQSRLLFARATGGQYEDNFKKDLYNVFTALNKMLSSSYDVILPTQCALLHSISAVYEQLMQVLPVMEVTKLATAMLESLPRDLSPQLTQAKLTAIRNLVTSKLFTDDGKYNQSRNMLTCCVLPPESRNMLTCCILPPESRNMLACCVLPPESRNMLYLASRIQEHNPGTYCILPPESKNMLKCCILPPESRNMLTCCILPPESRNMLTCCILPLESRNMLTYCILPPESRNMLTYCILPPESRNMLPYCILPPESRNMLTCCVLPPESRNMLLSICCKHLRVHLAHRDELRLCTEILGEILSFLFKQRQSQEQGKVNNCLHHDVEILCLTTLDMLIQTVLIIIDRSAAVLGCLVACLVGLLQLLDEFHYKRLWEELGDRKPKKDFLLRVFLVFRDLVKQEVFPADWLIIKMVINNIMLSALQELAQPLVFDFLDTRHFDNQVPPN
uniref:Dedicator of cytokinesis TPR repeats region domain-containing protein n=1 Tax=Timema shepardi TaxID=629360 RepID=A0A7R9B9T7_TIMSH|nr:unnamed protein product [Timema shepardi]